MENSNDGKLGYRVINLLGATFRFRIKRLETEFLFADGSVHVFSNWDVKGCRERFYMEEFVNVPIDEYLRMAAESGEIVEYGIKTSDVRRFVEQKAEFFEDLLLAAAGDMPLDSKENL
jgi:hypothetical protein